MNKLKHLFTALPLTVTAVAASAQETPPLRFGLIADIQHCDCQAVNNRHYRSTSSANVWIRSTVRMWISPSIWG